MTKNLFKYNYIIQQIPSNQYSTAILILSILELANRQYYQTTKAYLTPHFVATTLKNWDILVHHSVPFSFTSSFLSLQQLGLFQMVANPNFDRLLQKPQLIEHIHHLDMALHHIVFHPDFYTLLQNKESRHYLTTQLLERFFPETAPLFHRPNHIIKEQLQTIQKILVESSSVDYCAAYPDLPRLQQYLHQALSKRLLLKSYHQTCCVSELSIPDGTQVGLVNACYIRSYRNTKDYTVSNGLCMTPTLYQAFHQGLFCIDQNYKVRLSNKIAEFPQSERWLKLEGKKILLPKKEAYYPSLEQLKWHEEEVFIQRRGRRQKT